MNTNLLQHLINWPKSYITGTDLNIVIPGNTNAKQSIVKRAVKEGFLLRLKRELYLIQKVSNKPKVNNFELAQYLFGPSYISLESALSYHGWIPEAVYTISNVTIKRKKIFYTPIAVFSYEKIPNAIFCPGVEQIKDQHHSYLMATPWKAIADMIYTRKKTWSNVLSLSNDLRIEIDSLLLSDKTILYVLAETYPHKKTRQLLTLLYKDLKQYDEK